jgi:hypothetical protein
MKCRSILTHSAGLLLFLSAMVMTGCSGSSPSDGKNDLKSKTTFKIISSARIVTNNQEDQQNPQVIFLADKKVYFSVWEDNQNRNISGADIYGRFINQDGSMCGPAFQITNDSKNQTVPQAAYKLDPGNPVNNKIVIVWQDERGNSSSGYIYFTSIPATAIPSSETCGTFTPPAISNGTPVNYNGSMIYSTSVINQVINAGTGDGSLAVYSNFATPQTLPVLRTPIVPGSMIITTTIGRNVTQQIGTGDGTPGPYNNVILPPVKAGSVSVKAGGQTLTDIGGGGFLADSSTGHGTINYTTGVLSATFNANIPANTPVYVTYTLSRDVTLTDNGNGTISGVGGTGTLDYSTSAMRIVFDDPVASKEYIVADYQTYGFTGSQVNKGDILLSRKLPKIVYDKVNDRFIITWVEARNTPNAMSEACFGAVFNLEAGDKSFPGFILLNGIDLSNHPSPNGVMGADILRDSLLRTNRLVAHEASAEQEKFTYEYFTNTNSFVGISDTTSNETLFMLEGVRNKFELTCTIDLTTGIVKATTATEPYDGTFNHIYGTFEKDIKSSFSISPNSFLVSENTASNVYYPVASFDPGFKRFLVAWEDDRDSAGLNKIYGQLINSGVGPYNHNFIIGIQDTDNDGVQDPNVATSKQSSPAIAYDSVNQRFFVAWQDGRNSQYSLENLDIYGQFVDPDGSIRGSNFAIATPISNQLAPSIAYDSGKTQFLAIWKDARNANTANGSDIYGQLFSLGQPQLTLLKLDNTSLAPSNINFGSVIVNQINRESFKLRNTGDTYLSVDCISPLPTNPFSVDNLPTELNACGDGRSLNLSPGDETTLTVKFSPTTGGTFTGAFTIKSDGGERQVNLSGIGTPPTMTIAEGDGTNDGTLNYTNVQVGQTKDLAITVTNNSSVTYNIISIQGVNAPFSLVTPLTSSIAMAPSSSFEILVRYTPTEAGNSTAQLTINTDKSLSQTINLVGTATSSDTTTPPPPTGTGNNGSSSGGGTGGTSNSAPSSGGKSGCFIATAAYGSYMDPHVMVLRQFRDEILMKSYLGRMFVKFYYAYSPPVADFIREHETLRTITRWMLTPVILMVKYPLMLLLSFAGAVYVRRKSMLSDKC